MSPSSRASVPWYVWCAALAVTSAYVGGYWDISWHRSIGRGSIPCSKAMVASRSGCVCGRHRSQAEHDYDAVDLAMQGEVLVGFLANSLPRPQRQKRFESWLAAPGTEVADSFKPYLGLMGVSTSDSSLRTNYLKWYDATFNPTPFPDLTVGANDWALAGAVALLVAHQQGDLARSPRYAAIVESQLSQMADQTIARKLELSDAHSRSLYFALI